MTQLFGHTEANYPPGSLTGRLLVATPDLTDPNFNRTVIFMAAHEAEGALGLVLNRPTEEDLLDHVPEWRHLAASPAVIFAGGPVEPDGAMALGRRTDGAAPLPTSGAGTTGEVGDPDDNGWTPVTSAVGLIALAREPGEIEALGQMRLYGGHSGWGPGQLESEIAEEGWFVVDYEPDDIFTRDPDQLWRTVLRRQPGRLAMYANYPVDPAVN